MKHSHVTEKIIAAFYEVYNELGHGFLESVYEEALLIVLRKKAFLLTGSKYCRFGSDKERSPTLRQIWLLKILC